MAAAFVDSAMKLNYSHINYNSGDQIGVSYLQSSTKNGWRQSAAKAFLSGVKHRMNLDISIQSWATKLSFNANNDQVKSVKIYRNRKEFNVGVRKEVILSAGAFESPKLLMLSGIGPHKHLKELNIDIVKVLKYHFSDWVQYTDSMIIDREYFSSSINRIYQLVKQCMSIWQYLDQYSQLTI